MTRAPAACAAASPPGLVTRLGPWGPSGAIGSPEVVQGPATFGTVVTAVDVDGDAKLDIVSSEGSNVVGSNGMWLLFQRAGSFDSPLGGTNKAFNVSEIRPIRQAQTTSMSNRLFEVGDVTGDGVPEVFYSDSSSGVVRMLR